MKGARRMVRRLIAAALLFGCLSPVLGVHAAEPVTLAVADFDYVDTSGEMSDQRAVHAARLQQFASSLREGLSANSRFRIVQLACPAPPCSAAAMEPEALIAAARDAGAQLLLFGGIHKMS